MCPTLDLLCYMDAPAKYDQNNVQIAILPQCNQQCQIGHLTQILNLFLVSPLKFPNSDYILTSDFSYCRVQRVRQAQ